MFEPLKSADPPIIWGNNFVTLSITAEEHCLVAMLGLDSKYFAFSSLIKFSRSSKLFVLLNFSNSDLISLLLTFKFFFHSFSNSIPFFPISLQDSKTSSGVEKGSFFHLSFLRTKEISSSPKGEPWEEDFPDLLGEPKPIIVLHEISVGLSDLDALFIALLICFSLWPFISINFQP